jgi:Polyketide cyclase / dehydrase and lipid transport
MFASVRFAAMAVLTSTRVVSVPVAAAAALVLDWSRDPAWRSRVTRIEVSPPGPAVVGQEIVEHLTFGGKTYVTPTRIAEVSDRAAAYVGGSAAVTVSGSRAVEQIGPSSCRISTVLDIRMNGLLRPVTAFLAPSYKRIQEADLDRLVALLTTPDAAQHRAD